MLDSIIEASLDECIELYCTHLYVITLKIKTSTTDVLPRSYLFHYVPFTFLTTFHVTSHVKRYL
jgi:hypothetical protein